MCLGISDTASAFEVWEVAGHTLRNNVVGGQHCAFIDVIGNGIFIEGQVECLADLYIVEWFAQVIQRVVTNSQRQVLMVLVVGQSLSLIQFRSRYGCTIQLI